MATPGRLGVPAQGRDRIRLHAEAVIESLAEGVGPLEISAIGRDPVPAQGALVITGHAPGLGIEAAQSHLSRREPARGSSSVERNGSTSLGVSPRLQTERQIETRLRVSTVGSAGQPEGGSRAVSRPAARGIAAPELALRRRESPARGPQQMGATPYEVSFAEPVKSDRGMETRLPGVETQSTA